MALGVSPPSVNCSPRSLTSCARYFWGPYKADLVLYKTMDGLGYIGKGNGDGTFNFQSLFWGPSYDYVDCGDINGDGLTDVVLYNSSTGTMYAGISNGNGTFT